MKTKAAVVALVVVSLLGIGGFSNATDPRYEGIPVKKGFFKASDYRELSQSSKEAYAAGLIDGLLVSSLFGASQRELDKISICIKGMDNGQVAAIFDKYLREHPEGWHWPMNIVAFKALKAICP